MLFQYKIKVKKFVFALDMIFLHQKLFFIKKYAKLYAKIYYIFALKINKWNKEIVTPMQILRIIVKKACKFFKKLNIRCYANSFKLK